MKTFAFKNRLFLTFTVVITAVVSLFLAILLSIMSDTNRRTEIYRQQELFRGNLGEIESIIWQMDRLASQVIANNEILGVFIALSEDGDPSNHFDDNLIDAIHISSLLAAINGTDNYAARISVLNRHGDYVSTGTLYESPDRIREQMASAGFVTQLTNGANGHGAPILSLHPDTWSGNRDIRLISLYRPLSSFTNTTYGLVDVQVTAAVLDAQPFWQGDDGSRCVLVHADGSILHPQNVPGEYHTLLAGLMDTVRADGGTMQRTQLNSERVVAFMSRVDATDCFLVRITPEASLNMPYAQSYLVTVLATILLLLCLLAVINYLAIRITRPLQSLSATVADVNLQNIQQAIAQTAVSYPTAELNALGSAFHTMLVRLDASVAMEVQAHMRALQSQMNPHFLYNMLSVIIESSEEAGDKRTVLMCLRLSQMLRYIADYRRDSASLADEVQHARNYLELMRDRYEDQFCYTIDDDGDLAGCTVPKLILQPLAENCFTHGFRNRRPPWHIHIQTHVHAGRWTLTVSDNGSGIAPQVARDIHARVAQLRHDLAANYATLTLGGMGLVSTLLRLTLWHQEEIEYTIEPRTPNGTTIHIGGTCNDPCTAGGGRTANATAAETAD